MKYLLILLLFFLPCDAAYKVTWTEQQQLQYGDVDVQPAIAWPFVDVQQEKVFNTPKEAQDFKKSLPEGVKNVKYELVPDGEADKDLHRHLLDTDTTGNKV